MQLVAISNLHWCEHRRKRHEALFHYLLEDEPAFEGGIFINALGPGLADRAPEECVVHRGEIAGKPFSVVEPVAGRRDRMPAVVDRFAALAASLLEGRPYAVFANAPATFSFALTEKLNAGASMRLFDVADDYTAWHHMPHAAGNTRTLVAAADHVVYVNEATQKNLPHGRAIVLRNGCDFDNYAGGGAPFERPPLWPKPPGAIYCGYVGGFYPIRTDEALFHRLLDTFPEVAFHVFGQMGFPPKARAELERRGNFHHFDEVAPAYLPSVVRSFDVGIVPHAVNDMTAGNDLLKVLDYLAAGIPVVSTDCSDVRARYGDLVSVAEDADDFCAKLRAQIASRGAHDPRPGLARAEAFAWRARARELSAFWLGGA